MVSGRALFAGSTPQETVARLLHDSPPSMSSLESVAPKELRQIIGRAVDRVPDRRFEAAHDLALALRAMLTGSAAGAAGSRPRTKGKSLAVLPFANAGADPSTEYLIDGICENIINSLSQLSGVRVVPRSVVFRYKGLQYDPATVGVAVNARTILTGKVSQHGDSLSIQAELVDTNNESQLWGEQFRLRVSELPNVQQEIAWQISEALRLKLTRAQKQKLREKIAVDPEAYQEYLRGRHHFNTWSPEGFRKALEHFERAIDHDPTYAPAYAGLGDTVGSMSYYGFVSPQQGFPRAQAAAHKAIALDPDLADPYATLGLGTLFHLWDWETSEGYFKKAIALNPRLASARSFYAILMSTTGRHEEAIVEARTAQELDPLSPLVNMCMAWALHFAGRANEAVAELLRTQDLLRGDARDEPRSLLVLSYELLGKFEDAARAGMNSRVFGVLVDSDALLAAYRADGPRGYWSERLAELDRAAPTARELIHFTYAHVCAQLGRPEAAVEHLTTLVDQHHGAAVFFALDPALAALRGRADFDALMARIGAPHRPTVSATRTAST
jgi:TolB-like protein